MHNTHEPACIGMYLTCIRVYRVCHLVRNTCSSSRTLTPLSDSPREECFELIVSPTYDLSQRPPDKGDNRRAQVYTDCRSSLSCRAKVLDGQNVMFGRRRVRGSAELSALVLWKAEDDPVEYEAVDDGEDGQVGAETGHNNEPPLVVVNNVDARDRAS